MFGSQSSVFRFRHLSLSTWMKNDWLQETERITSYQFQTLSWGRQGTPGTTTVIGWKHARRYKLREGTGQLHICVPLRLTGWALTRLRRPRKFNKLRITAVPNFGEGISESEQQDNANRGKINKRIRASIATNSERTREALGVSVCQNKHRGEKFGKVFFSSQQSCRWMPFPCQQVPRGNFSSLDPAGCYFSDRADIPTAGILEIEAHLIPMSLVLDILNENRRRPQARGEPISKKNL
ncbi:unnamed protein product, partial [Nesidiocoris tenuis]